MRRTTALGAIAVAAMCAPSAFAQSVPYRVVIAEGDTTFDGNQVRRLDRLTIGPGGEVVARVEIADSQWYVDRLASGGSQHGLLPEGVATSMGTFRVFDIAGDEDTLVPSWGPQGQLFLKGSLEADGGTADALVLLDRDAQLEILGTGPIPGTAGAYPTVPGKPAMATDGSILLRVGSDWFLHGPEPTRIAGAGDSVPGDPGLQFGELSAVLLDDGGVVLTELDDYYSWRGGELAAGPIPPGLDEPALRALQMVAPTGYVLWRGPIGGVDSGLLGPVGAEPTLLGPAEIDQACPNGGDISLQDARTIDRAGRIVAVRNCGIARLSPDGIDFAVSIGELVPFEAGSQIELSGVGQADTSPHGDAIVFNGFAQHATLGSVNGLWRIVGDGEPEFLAREGASVADAEITSLGQVEPGAINDVGQVVVLARTDSGKVGLVFGQELELADLALVTPSDLYADNNTPIDVTIEVVNNGPQTAADVRMIVPLDPTFAELSDQCESDGDNTVCTLGELANGASASVSFAGYGGESFQVRVAASTADPNPVNNEAIVQIGRSYGFPENPDGHGYDEVNPPGQKEDAGCCATVSSRARAPMSLLVLVVGALAARRREHAAS